MQQRIEKFLEFNNKRITLLLSDGSWWIAIKPICEALDVSYSGQFERIQRHKILSQLFVRHEWLAADGKLREMLCLPEKYIYGWLFSINSDSPGLIEYQHKCYDILYNHFHGTITGRITALNEKVSTEIKIAQLQEKLNEELKQSEVFKQIQELKANQKRIYSTLKECDAELISGQLSLNL